MSVGTPVSLAQYLSTSNVLSGVATLTAPASVGTVLAVAATSYVDITTASMTCADSKGNTWTLQAHSDQVTAATFAMSYIWTTVVTNALAAGDTVTVTRTAGAVRSLGIDVLAIPGADRTTPVNATATSQSSTNTTAPVGGSVASVAGELVLTSMAWTFTGVTVSSPTPSGAVLFVNADTNSHRKIVLYRQSTATGGINQGVTVSAASKYAAATVNFKASATNNPPSVNAGADVTVDPNLVDTFTLTAAGVDTDGTVASYLWEDITGTPATVGNTASITLAVTRTVAQTVRTYRCTVTDNNGATGTDSVLVTFLPHARWLKKAASLVPLRRLV